MDQRYDDVVKDPKYMLIGEAWGSDEEQAQRPFIGSAGQQLNKLLYGSGIERGECYVTNVINERPTRNNFGLYYEDGQRKVPTPKLLQAWKELLEKIDAIKPDVVVPLGNEALKAVTGYEGIENWRGSIIQIRDHKVLPTVHPSAILRGGGKSHWYLPAAVHDFRKARLVRERKVEVREIKTTVVTTAKQIDEFFVSCKGQSCAFDIETTSKGGEQIKCIGFSKDGIESVVVSFMEGAPEMLGMLAVIERWMTGNEIQWIGQNAYNFDIPVIKNIWGFEVKNFVHDTLVAHQVLHPELPHDLAVLASFYTNIQYWKHLSETDLFHYNGIDAAATWSVAEGEIAELQSRGLLEQYRTYQHKLLFPMKMMYEQGIQIDREYKDRFKQKLKTEAKEAQVALDKYYLNFADTRYVRQRWARAEVLISSGRKHIRLPKKEGGKVRRRKKLDTIIKKLKETIKKRESLNVRSKDQLAKFLYVTLKLPKRTKHGKVTTDENALISLYIKTKHEFLKKILNLRRVRNKYSKYGRMQLDQQGRVRTTYKFVETGRLSSGKYEAK